MRALCMTGSLRNLPLFGTRPRQCSWAVVCIQSRGAQHLITVTRHDCMESRYKMERYSTVFMNAADRNDTWGINQAKTPKYPSAAFRKCLEIFIQMGKRHWCGCRTSERTVLVHLPLCFCSVDRRVCELVWQRFGLACHSLHPGGQHPLGLCPALQQSRSGALRRASLCREGRRRHSSMRWGLQGRHVCQTWCVCRADLHSQVGEEVCRAAFWDPGD